MTAPNHNSRVLKEKTEKEYKNFIYATAGLGAYEREPLPWAAPGEEKKIFYPMNGQLTEETLMSILIALQMLNLTLIDRERQSNPNSELVRASYAKKSLAHECIRRSNSLRPIS